MKFCVFICWALFASHLHAQDSGETWKIISLYWPPYAGQDLPGQGSAIVRLRNLLGQKGIKLEVEFHDWQYGQTLARSGEYFGYYPAWPEEVKAQFFPSPAIEWSMISVIEPNLTPTEFDTIDQLFSTVNVGLIGSYVYPEEIQTARQQHPQHVVISHDDKGLIKLFESKKISVAITDPFVFSFFNHSNDYDTGLVLMEKELVVAVYDSQKNRLRFKTLLNAIDQQ